MKEKLKTNLAATSCGESDVNSGSVSVSAEDDNIGSITIET